MNTEEFSAVSFDRMQSAVFARALSDKLQEAVLLELEPVVRNAFSRIIAALNAEGHNLKPYGPDAPGEFCFRDESLPGLCKLRLACDVVISAGYADTVLIQDL